MPEIARSPRIFRCRDAFDSHVAAAGLDPAAPVTVADLIAVGRALAAAMDDASRRRADRGGPRLVAQAPARNPVPPVTDAPDPLAMAMQAFKAGDTSVLDAMLAR